jgi:hypothetical protein
LAPLSDIAAMSAEVISLLIDRVMQKYWRSLMRNSFLLQSQPH